MTTPRPERPEPGTEVSDGRHVLQWLELRQDPIVGFRARARIFPIKRGRRSGKGKLVSVGKVHYDHWRDRPGEPVAYFLPVTDAQMKKFDRSGERFAMPGQIKD